ncbi:septation protein SepH [Microbacterium sp.]|uniref:septation protein SepH n=1 Tax=Microbacterium sp. TaxID=51671 RepID=UPI0027361456|nr:septation protein SepH [Microbacterium sp.]MDP3949439.1 septation protein SepH [Microbacterium sp.]
MENVTIVGTEDDLLILATGSGERFALAIDDVLQREIRRARRRDAEDAPKVSVSPREIQAHVRSGLSAAEVAELLGISVDDVARFEGPVLAEREHIIGQALAVPVLIGSEVEPDAQPTFGVAIHAKLADLQASTERWASWKDDSGWIVKLEFEANEVSHDARWSFDPRRSALSPLNADATQLSRQGSLPEGLIPRLRAVDSDRAESPYKDDSRFDSGAFGPRLLPTPDADVEEPAQPERSNAAAQAAAIKRAPDDSVTSAETADLLEALRRRRGQRESAPLLDDEPSSHSERTDDSGPIALFESLEPEYVEQKPARTSERAPEDSNPESTGRRRRRNAMPSWDEIVFGARTDD